MREIYLDYNSSSPLDGRVVEEMRSVGYGNASSVHRFGRRQAAAVDGAREHVAALLGASPSRIVFTSGATEANNLALRGLCGGWSRRSRIFVAAVEHTSVLATVEHIADTRPITRRTLPVTSGGFIDTDAATRLLTVNALAVSAVAANSETGVVNDVAGIAAAAHNVGALVHCDATQMVGRMPFDMASAGADLVTVSAHKMCGPGGVGALAGTREALGRITPLIYGGPHEKGLRAGSLNVAGIVGFGAAARIVMDERTTESARVGVLRDRLVAGLKALLPSVTENGDPARRLPNTANLRFAGADADAVMVAMDPVAVSAGSACSAGTLGPSPALLAMGISRQGALESLRFSLGRFTTASEISAAITVTAAAVQHVRAATLAVA